MKPKYHKFSLAIWITITLTLFTYTVVGLQFEVAHLRLENQGLQNQVEFFMYNSRPR